MILPTPRAALAAAAGAPVAVVLGALNAELWWVGVAWVGAVALAVVADAFAVSRARAPVLAIDAPASGDVGRALRVSVTVTPPSPARVALTIDPRLAMDGPARRALAADGTAAYEAVPVRRGRATVGPAEWARLGPLGLTERTGEGEAAASVLITPDVGHVRSDGLQLFRRDVTVGQRPQYEVGAGAEFQALVPFRAGMDKRLIDWKRSARHGDLVAREHRSERDNNIVLAVDCGRLMSEPVAGLARLDHATAAALLCGYVALRLGDRVTLFGFDARPRVASPALTGVRAFAQLRGFAGQLDYAAREPNYTLALAALGQRLDRRSLILLFTDFVDTVGAELMLRAAARLLSQHLLVAIVIRDEELESLAETAPGSAADVSRAVVAAGLLRERRIVIARLRRMGVDVIEARHDRIGPRLVEDYLAIRAAGRL